MVNKCVFDYECDGQISMFDYLGTQKIGLIDVDNYKTLDSCFPNLVLMKLSAWHKKKGDIVEWCDPNTHYDKVYMSKVFSFTEDYPFEIDADEVVRGGSGYCISLVDGKEVFDKSKDKQLPYEIEHIYPDYDLYGIKDFSYGVLSRGCPRGCAFCHTGAKDGLKSHKVADLSEFWSGQKNIVLLDQNILAVPEWRDLLQQLADSKARVEFNGGLDIRLMTLEKAELLSQIKVFQIHFAWDRYEDKEIVVPRLKAFGEYVGFNYCRAKVQCYVLVNFNTTLEQDLERVMTLKALGMSPYIMRYDKEHIPRGHVLNKLARWCNHRGFFWRFETFDDFLANEKNTH